MAVYLIHLDRPVRVGKSAKRHYIGSATDVARREREHGTKRGARLLRQAATEGIPFHVVRVWEGGAELERRLKRRGHADRLCPICREGREASV